MAEYIQSKRRHAVDFQLRMTATPFNQHCKVKVRDKGYPALEKREGRLTINDLKEIFKNIDQKGGRNEEKVEEALILKQAFYITKSVPRQTNRCKWREKSGFNPNMLMPSEPSSGKLFANDLVFTSCWKRGSLQTGCVSVFVCVCVFSFE